MTEKQHPCHAVDALQNC